jgi:catechol 2,3-dioxygenase-like lactoylglutathione lyase family enzyme
MSGKATELGHTGICVSDLETSLEFYRGLGFELRWQSELQGADVAKLLGLARAKLRICSLVLGPNAIELFQFAEPQGRDLAKVMRQCDRAITHIGLTVTGLDEIYSHLVRTGYDAFSEPVALPGGARAVFLRDPDGIPIELFEPAQG